MEATTLPREADPTELTQQLAFSPPNSASMKEVVHLISQVAPLPVNVLLLGETGSGKEILARLLHSGSPRVRSRFVAVNVAAFDPGLFRSEMIGHERGAYTDAVSQTTGWVPSAHEGTLFLDEIGDLHLEGQAAL